MKITPDIIEEFNSKYEIVGDCWIWTGAIDTDGYGRFYKDNRYIRAHRLAYKLFKGEPGEAVCHSCDNRACVNHNHLYSSTRRVNNMDKMLKGRANIQSNDIVIQDQIVIYFKINKDMLQCLI